MPGLFGVSMPLGVECNGTKIRDTAAVTNLTILTVVDGGRMMSNDSEISRPCYVDVVESRCGHRSMLEVHAKERRKSCEHPDHRQ